MKRMQAFKFKLKTKQRQAQFFSRIVGACRYVYNHALAIQKARYEANNKKLNYAGLCKMLTLLKQDKATAWLNQVPSQALQQSLKDLERAYQHFFAKRAAFPVFKKRGIRDACRFPQGCKLNQDTHQLFLPKIGWVSYFYSKKIAGDIKNVTLSRKADGWYVSIQTEREVEKVIHPKESMVGIDVGIAQFATLSTGEVYEAAHALKNEMSQLAYQQRRLAKKIKFSQNWRKQKHKIARLHQTISNIRLNHMHQISHDISKNHAMIVLEDLKIKNMSKSAAGSLKQPGKKVKAKSGLNRAILDQGFGEFRRQLQYKATIAGGDVILIDPKYTSQTCPKCHYVDKENRKTQSSFRCLSCDFFAQADFVGALNILAAGHAVLACGETAR